MVSVAMTNHRGHPPRRTNAGPHWNEGAHRLWLFMRSQGLSMRGLSRLLTDRDDTGTIIKILYGDRRPGRDLGNTIEQVTGIGSALFSEPSAAPLSLALTGGQEAA
jgi:hypothetical protein